MNAVHIPRAIARNSARMLTTAAAHLQHLAGREPGDLTNGIVRHSFEAAQALQRATDASPESISAYYVITNRKCGGALGAYRAATAADALDAAARATGFEDYAAARVVAGVESWEAHKITPRAPDNGPGACLRYALCLLRLANEGDWSAVAHDDRAELRAQFARLTGFDGADDKPADGAEHWWLARFTYIGPNRDENRDADYVLLTGEQKENGAFGDWSWTWHGPHSSAADAEIQLRELVGATRPVDPDRIDDLAVAAGLEHAAAAWRLGEYEPLNADQTLDFYYDDMADTITAGSTDDELAELVEQLEQDANGRGYSASGLLAAAKQLRVEAREAAESAGPFLNFWPGNMTQPGGFFVDSHACYVIEKPDEFLAQAVAGCAVSCKAGGLAAALEDGEFLAQVQRRFSLDEEQLQDVIARAHAELSAAAEGV